MQKTYDATRAAIAPYVAKLQPRLQSLRDAFELCYAGAEEGKASCYYALFEVVREELLQIVQEVRESRPILVTYAVNLLDDYYTCRAQ